MARLTELLRAMWRKARTLVGRHTRARPPELEPLPPGFRVGRYSLIDAIGQGAFGRVYRAHDAQLNADVAVYVLSASLRKGKDRLAFMNWARHAARGDIEMEPPCSSTSFPAFDYGLVDGIEYAVLKYVESK